MNRYIITNCPAYLPKLCIEDDTGDSTIEQHVCINPCNRYCADTPNCLMKRCINELQNNSSSKQILTLYKIERINQPAERDKNE